MSYGSRAAEVVTLSRHRSGAADFAYNRSAGADYTTVDHQDNRIDHNEEDRMDDAAYGSKVGRLKSLFQQRMKTEDNYVRPGFNNRINTSRQNDNKTSSQGVTSPPGYRSTHPVSPDVRSPESKRKHASDDYRDPMPYKNQQRDTSKQDVADGDAQQFLESANHVQRFQYSRMMFARMADQNKGKSAIHVNVGGRRGSPSRGVMSPPSPGSPLSSSSSMSPHQLLSPPEEVKQRSSSDPSEMEHFVPHNRSHAYHASETGLDRWNQGADVTNSSHYVSPPVSSYHQQRAAVPPTQNSNRYQDKNVARSRSDVGQNHVDVSVDESVSGPLRSRLQQFENQASKQPSQKDNNFTRPNRFMRDENNYKIQERKEPPSLPPRNYRQQSLDNKSPPDTQSTYSSQSQHVNSSPWEEDTPPPLPPQATRPDTLATKTNRYNHNDYSRTEAESEAPPPYRVNRYSQEEVTQPPQPLVDVNSAAASNTGVLLRRRRREDERRLSREEIKASLDAADAYWHKWQQESSPSVDKMTESNISSGSGEETAKSDLEREDIEQSMDPEEQRRSWAEKPRAQRRSRSSDYMEDRAHAIQRSLERESHRETTKRYSEDFSQQPPGCSVKETSIVTAHTVHTVNSAESLSSSTNSSRPRDNGDIVDLTETEPQYENETAQQNKPNCSSVVSDDANTQQTYHNKPKRSSLNVDDAQGKPKRSSYTEDNDVQQQKVQNRNSLPPEVDDYDATNQAEDLANHIRLGGLEDGQMDSSVDEDVDELLDKLMANTDPSDFTIR